MPPPPGRTSRRLPAWHCYSAADAQAGAKAITRLVPLTQNRRDRDVANALARFGGRRQSIAIVSWAALTAEGRAVELADQRSQMPRRGRHQG